MTYQEDAATLGAKADAQITALASQVAADDRQITDLEQQVDDLTADLAAANAQIAALQTPQPPPPVTPPAGPTPPPGFATLLWADDFAGTTIDASKWNVRDKATSSTGAASRNAANVTVSAGLLREQIRREESNGKHFTAGYIDTNGKFATPTDRKWAIEFKSFIPHVDGKSAGLWTAFWLRNATGQGEVDFLEVWGTPGTNGHTFPAGKGQITFHEKTDGSGHKVEKRVDCAWNTWHVFRIEHDPTDTLRPWWMYIDGVLVQAVNAVTQSQLESSGSTKAPATWLTGPEWTGGWNIRYSSQIGAGSFYWGTATAATDLPVDFGLDYLRVWT